MCMGIMSIISFSYIPFIQNSYIYDFVYTYTSHVSEWVNQFNRAQSPDNLNI